MLDHNGPGRRVAVAHGVDLARPFFALLDRDAAADPHACDLLISVALPRFDLHAEIDAVREQPFVARLDWLEQAFAGERRLVEHGEGPAVECEAARVREPQRAQGPHAIAFVPERHAVDTDFRSDNRHEGRLILADRDLTVDAVLEQIAKVFTLRRCLHVLESLCDRVTGDVSAADSPHDAALDACGLGRSSRSGAADSYRLGDG